MNKFLSSSSSGISEDRVREIIEDISVIYNDDSSVSINNSANASIYTLPTVSGVAGNSVVVGADGKHLVFTTLTGLTNPLTDVLNANGNSIVGIYRLSGTGLGPELLIDSHVNMLNYTMKNLTSIQGSGGKLELISSNLHMNSGIIYNASSIVGAGLNNDLLISGSITLNGDINMDNFTLNNVRNVNKSSINFSLIPATAGSPGQVLTRASNFDIKDPLTAQLVWTTPSGGGVQNPMTVDLNGGGLNITNLSSLTTTELKVSSINLASGTIIQTSPLAVNTQLKVNNINTLTNPTIAMPSVDFSGTIKTNTIATYSGTDISVNGNLSFVQNIPVLSSPNGLRIRVAEIYNTGLVTSFLGDCVFSNVVLFANGIETNTIKQRTGTALGLTSPTINITGSTAINLTGPTTTTGNATFQSTVRTNTIDTYSGGNISCLQNLTLAVGKQLKSDLVFTNGLRSNSGGDLFIAGLLPDNKTQTNIVLSSPTITLNNQFDPLLPESCLINILGTLRFDNTITDSIIRGGYIMIDSKYTNNTATPLYLKGSEIEMTSSVNDIKITVPVNKYIDLQGNVIVGDGKTSQIQSDVLYPRTTQFVTTSNFSANHRIYSHMNALDNDTNSRNVRTSLFKYYGPHTFITPLNTTTPAIISYTNGSSVGSKIQDTAHLNSGDRLCFTLTGLLTTAGGGSMNIYVYAGVAGSLVQVTSFTKTNIVLNNAPVKITIDCDIIKSPGANSLNNIAYCTLHRDDNSVCNLVGTIGATIPDNPNTQYEIYASHTVAQAGSTFKLLTYSMELY